MEEKKESMVPCLGNERPVVSTFLSFNSNIKHQAVDGDCLFDFHWSALVYVET